MTQRESGAHKEARVIGFIDRLNRGLLPAFGPPPLGPYEEATEAARAWVCPSCGRPLEDHDIDRSGRNTELYCRYPAVDTALT